MNQVQSAEIARPRRRVGLYVTLLLLLAIGAALTWRGFGFYRLGLVERATHPDYRTLRPSGLIGHGYGMVGTALILTNLLYLLRRRFAKYVPAWAGSMRAWLNLHVFTGLVGSLLIVFHSAFQLRTPIATLTSVSLAIVVVTGLVGLYLYALIPKQGLQPLHDRLAVIRPLLPGLADSVEDFIRRTPLTPLPANASFTRTILTIPRWVLEARARRKNLRAAARQDKTVRVLEHTHPALARAFIQELSHLAAAEADTHAGAALMRSWRSLHRFLALLMIASVSVHIGVAWFYGFRWIFE